MRTNRAHVEGGAAGIAAAALWLAGCGAGSDGLDGPPLAGLTHLESPASPGSGEPNLFAAPDGRVYLSWIEPTGERTHALRLAVRGPDGAWGAARTVAEGESWFVNWADFPSIVALPDGSLAAHWLVRSGPGTYAYDVRVARSFDRGETWTEPIVPHRDGTQTEHGFVSLFPWEDGRLAIVWLDGRNWAAANGNGAVHEMMLRHTLLAGAAELDEEVVLDPRVCDCCQTSAALTDAGPIVVYRGRSAEEVRDILIVRHVNGRWTEPHAVYDDGWVIPACPVNGPFAAADGTRVAVAWFTAARDTARVRVAFSADAGASFGAAVRVDDGDPVGRVAVAMLPGGDALVSWLERLEDAAEVRVRRVRANGLAGPAATVARSSAARASGFPRMALTPGGELIFAWTEPGQPSHVRLASARPGQP